MGIDITPLADLASAVPPRRVPVFLDRLGALVREAGQDVGSSWVARRIVRSRSLAGWLGRMASGVSDETFEAFMGTFLADVLIGGRAARSEYERRHCHPGPGVIGVSPTTRGVPGCEEADMDRDVLERVLAEARDIGARLVVVSGGEPLLYPHLLDVAGRFHDLVFVVHTKGAPIDDAAADRLARLGTVWPALRVDAAAGALDAMGKLARAGVLVGFSVTASRASSDEVASDGFLDLMQESGALFGLFHQYVPVGGDADPDLMSTPAQRLGLASAIRRWHCSRPLLVGDLWSGGSCALGCMAASRCCFVAADGAVQPCSHVGFASGTRPWRRPSSRIS
jgi:hypothetical protein